MFGNIWILDIAKIDIILDIDKIDIIADKIGLTIIV